MRSDDLMLRAIELAKKGAGYVSPNPLVGAVIVKDGKIISEGWHKKYGSIHAEVDAINNAGIEDLTGATIAVNLEPCSHFGKQPPCCDAINEHKFGRVVIGMTDPNPEVSGQGIERLRNAGIEVEVDVLRSECRFLNRYFYKYMTEKRPYVIAKSGISADGCISTYSGNSKWISCEESRRRVHILRSQVDAILIGENTALKDNPKLNVRNVSGRNPRRVVLDTNLSLSLELEVFKDNDRDKTIVFCSEKSSKVRKADNLRMAGVSVIPTTVNKDNEICLDTALSILSEKFAVSSLMVEGGARVFSSFLKANLIDEMKLYKAPIFLGKGVGMFDHFKPYSVNDAIKFKYIDFGWSGEDLEITAIRINESDEG